MLREIGDLGTTVEEDEFKKGNSADTGTLPFKSDIKGPCYQNWRQKGVATGEDDQANRFADTSRDR